MPPQYDSTTGLLDSRSDCSWKLVRITFTFNDTVTNIYHHYVGPSPTVLPPESPFRRPWTKRNTQKWSYEWVKYSDPNKLIRRRLKTRFWSFSWPFTFLFSRSPFSPFSFLLSLFSFQLSPFSILILHSPFSFSILHSPPPSPFSLPLFLLISFSLDRN